MFDGGKNPCDCCKAKDRVSGCNNCVLEGLSDGECHNDECFVNYECGCLLGFDGKCKASTCYEDDYRDHDCDECVHWLEKSDKYGGRMNYCDLTGDPACDHDQACEDFEEGEG